MRSLPCLLCAVAITVAHVGTPLLAQEKEYKDAERKFQEAFANAETPVSTKVEAIRNLVRYASGKNANKAASLLIDVLKDRRAIPAGKIAEYEKKMADLQKEMDAIMLRVKQAGNKITQADDTRRQQINADMQKLRDLLRSNSHVQDAAIEALGNISEESARQDVLKAMGNSSDPELTCALLESVRRWRSQEAFDVVAALYDKAKKWDNVRAQIVVVLRDLDAARGLPIFIQASTDSSQFVRSQAIPALRQARKNEGIDALINMLEKEPPGRIQNEVLEALHELTGKTEFGPDITVWRGWWNRVRGNFVMPPKPEKKEPQEIKDDSENGNGGARNAEHRTGAFYGIPIKTKRMVFVIDRSGSMQSSADINDPQADPQGGPAAPPPGKRSKWEALQAELSNAIDQLPEDAQFAIVWYSTEVSCYKDGKMVTATKKEKEQAKAAVKAMNAEGLTNIYEAMEKGFEIAQGAKLKGMVVTGGGAEMKADTIFFMTDGSPTCGPSLDGVTPQDRAPQDQYMKYTRALLEEICKWNSTRGLVINCVCVGQGDEQLLKQLAARNKGSYKHVVK